MVEVSDVADDQQNDADISDAVGERVSDPLPRGKWRLVDTESR